MKKKKSVLKKKAALSRRAAVLAGVYAQEKLPDLMERMYDLAMRDEMTREELSAFRATQSTYRAFAQVSGTKEQVLHKAGLLRNVPAQRIGHQTIQILNYDSSNMSDAEKEILQKLRLAQLRGEAIPLPEPQA